MDNKELLHYGIRGMKWGVRRNNPSGGSASSTSKKVYRPLVNLRPLTNPRIAPPSAKSDDTIKKDTLKSKKISEMSNAEIRQLNERLQLEKQYKELTRADVSPGRKFVTNILTSAAKDTASKYVSKYMTKGIDVMIKKATG